jgi:hypothetical protein
VGSANPTLNKLASPVDLQIRKAILIIRCTKPASVFGMPKPFTLSSRSNLRMLRCLQCCHSCATSRHGNGSVGLWRLSHFTHVHSWSNKRTMLLLSYCQLSHGRYKSLIVISTDSIDLCTSRLCISC